MKDIGDQSPSVVEQVVDVVVRDLGERRLGGLLFDLAEQGLEDIKKHVDTLIIIPNQNLFRIANEQTTFADAFQMADRVLYSGVRGITDLMVMPGLINLDFADVRTVMAEMGAAMMGTGEGTGESRALEAAQQAVANPLLDDISLKGAKGVLINITGGYDMTLYEVDEAANEIRNQVDADANIILGSTFDESIEGKMRVSVVATGIDSSVVESAPVEAAPVKTVAPAKPAVSEVPRPVTVPVAPEVEEPKPIISRAEPEVVEEIEPEIAEPEAPVVSGNGHVTAEDVFGAFKKPPGTRIDDHPREADTRSSGLHNLFGWRRPSGEDADTPFEDVQPGANDARSEPSSSMSEDIDLEIPAFLRRSANR